MLQSLHESDSTFTQSRVESIFWKQSGVSDKSRFRNGLFIQNFTSSGLPGPSARLMSPEQREKLKLWCIDLLFRLRHGEASDLIILDSAYSEFLECSFSAPSREEGTQIVVGACEMLKEIPVVAPKIHGRPATELYENFPITAFIEDSTPQWDAFRVARYVSSNTISIALWVRMSAKDNTTNVTTLDGFINLTMALLVCTIKLSTEQPSTKWFLIKSFLWTSWQRAATLRHYHLLGRVLRYGWSRIYEIHDALEGLDTIQELVSDKDIDGTCKTPPYMCNWAFRLLRADKHYVGQDLRRFFERFAEHFSNHTPRCTRTSTGGPESCDGIHPARCLRLSGLIVENQSAHTAVCDGCCPRLYWDRRSWVSIGGNAAVLVNTPDDGVLRYCAASKQTLAVSHVWSHGQGGRPEDDPQNEGTGLNRCLHKRYSEIAQVLGCNSYWMDTPCIPSNHVLRGEAIANINRIFTNSKVTLVCDRDLMTIDISKPEIATMETILVTILTCDWNVRAWTLLEALRARQSIHILCKNDRVIALKYVVEMVMNRGCIDIAVAFLTAQHLLPSQNDNNDLRYSNRAMHLFPGRYAGREDPNGFVPLSVAASLLSHRHASRPGDEIVIWGLLMEDDAFNTAEAFWQHQVGNRVPTGFLVSDSPRVSGKQGFSWAPARPNFPLFPERNHDKLLHPYDGVGTDDGFITREGYEAPWYAHIFKVQDGMVDQVAQKATINAKSQLEVVETLATQYLQRYSWCALLQPSSLYSIVGTAHPRRPDDDVFVVAGSDDGQTWKWLGLLHNKKGAPLPDFELKRLLIG
jgi:hypothetical protein